MNATVGAVAQLVAVIQRQLAAPANTGSLLARRPVAPRTAAGHRYAKENLAPLIELRVRQIGKDDPDRGRKAFRVFLEAVLLSQLGEGLLNDPQFYQLVDDVLRAMEGDTVCRPLIDSAIEQLLSGK